MKKKVRYTIYIKQPIRSLSPGDLPGLLDMLRYDGATVISWDRETTEHDYIYKVNLEADHPAFDRWRSFGIRAEERDAFFK